PKCGCRFETAPQTMPPAAPPKRETVWDTGQPGQVKDLPARADGPEGEHAFLRPAQQPDELGRLGPYRILNVLGRGGMGLVYQAEDPRLKRSIALKIMRPQYATNASARQRFLREAQAQAAL